MNTTSTSNINQISVAHNVLQSIDFANGEIFLHRHVLYYAKSTQDYINNFVANLTVIPESARDIEKLGDIGWTCKTFWNMLAYDPQFMPEDFAAFVQRVYLARPDLSLVYISKTMHRIAILHAVAAQASPQVTPHELIKSVGAIEAADIVHAHTQAAKHLPSTEIKLINDYEFKSLRKSAADLHL